VQILCGTKEKRNRNTFGDLSALKLSAARNLVGFKDIRIDRLEQSARQARWLRVHCLPFAEQVRLNELYNAADIAVLPNASISCQAALGTGLTVCLANNGTMDHLIRHPSQAAFFDPAQPEELSHRLIDFADSMYVEKSVRERHMEREVRPCEPVAEMATGSSLPLWNRSARSLREQGDVMAFAVQQMKRHYGVVS
jgi:hypothetical protein